MLSKVKKMKKWISDLMSFMFDSEGAIESGPSLARREFELSRLKVFQIVTASTSVFMWLYVLVSYIYMQNRLVWMVGFCCAFLHTFAYHIYKHTHSAALASYVLVGTGMIFQTTFAHYNDGFFSATLIWVAILPLIVGVLSGMVHTFVWFFISSFCVVLEFWFTRNGYTVNALDPRGAVLVQFMISAGIIILISGFTVVSIRVGQIYRRHLMNQNLQIQSLLRTLSHDVATPLTTIRMSAEKALATFPGDASLVKLERASKNISDILDYVRRVVALDAGKISIQVEPVRLLDVCNDCWVVHEDIARNKQVELDFEVSEGIAVLGNRSVLANHVISNLISNALKFSFAGGKIEARAIELGSEVLITIRDYGVGIDEQRLAQLFRPGKSNSTRGTANELGTGFGMLLVKTYLEAMGGRIEVQSWVAKPGQKTFDRQSGTLMKVFLQKA